VDGTAKTAVGEKLRLTCDPAAVHLFDPATGEAL